MNHPVKHLPEVEKGDSDWRTYRSLKLENGVTCVLVHDKESKHTAMATTIDAGASCDPRSLSGLAHFTEHMCFLGKLRAFNSPFNASIFGSLMNNVFNLIFSRFQKVSRRK